MMDIQDLEIKLLMRQDDTQKDVDKSLWGELEPELEYKDMTEEGKSLLRDKKNQSIDNWTLEAISEEEDIQETMNEEDIPITEMDTSDDIELRKRPSSKEAGSNEAKHLYHVLSPSSRGTMQGFMGSRYTYNLSSKKGRHEHDVDISMEDPREFENISSLQSKYEQAQLEDEEKKHYPAQHEDLSDMYMEHISRQAKKMKQLEKRKESRKKEFRF